MRRLSVMESSVVLRRVFAMLSAALAASTAWAANPDGPLRVEVIAAYNLVVDSNVESPSTYAPRAAYLGAKIWNDGTTTMSNVVAYIGDYIDGANDTPGHYPTNRHPAYPTIVGPLTNGMFVLTHEGGAAGAADATRPLGPIAPGQYTAVYWLISYPHLDKNGKAVWGPSVKPDDDLWLEYDVWAKAVEAGTPRTAVQTRRVTMRNEISAMANKIKPNTANKVPQEYQDLLNLYVPTWTNSATDGTPGSRVTAEGVWYDLGNIGQGFDNDGDLVPDQNAWMQPVGDASVFDPTCFRLVHTYALVIVKLKTGGEDVIYAEDQLYFQNIPENNGAVGWVGYEFVPLRGGCSSALTPYQEVASGFDNEKFNGDYGAVLGGSIGSVSSAVELVKSADGLTVRPGGTLWYSLTYTPTRATFASGLPLLLGDPDAGVPVVIQDQIPAGTTYIPGTAEASNSVPGGMGSYTVLYSTNNAISWQSTEPSPATNVTDLQWWLSEQLAGGTTGTVRFAVSVDNPFSEPVPEVSNTGCLSFGNNECDTNSIVRTPVLGSNVLGDLVFKDNGAGAFYGNGTNDTGETGISNVTVRVYYDANSNGVVDAGDSLRGTTNTSASGLYLFTALPDGKYVVVVDATDTDIPLGYSPTTPTVKAISLDPNHTTTAPVTNLTADFGFAPALTLDKSLIGSGPVYEGGQATFRLAVTNQFPGNGSGLSGTLIVTNWATSHSIGIGGGWVNQANLLNGPDSAMSSVTVKSQADAVNLSGFNVGSRSETITNVTLAVKMGAVTGTSGFLYNIKVQPPGGTLTTVASYSRTAMPAQNAFILINLTGLRTWAWSDFATTLVQLYAQKSGGSGDAVINVDAVGFRIATDVTYPSPGGNNTLYPVPLNDRYDADLLRFVSATPPVSFAAAGQSEPLDGMLYWDNIGPIMPGGTSVVYVTFDVLEPLSNKLTTVTNMAYVNSATFSNGIPANTATDLASVVVQPTAAIGDYVWRDVDGDGVQDSNEVGIANVKVVLTRPVGPPLTNTTDSTGYYLFTGLTATNYTVTVLTSTLPSATFTQTYDPDTTTNNATSVTITNAPGGGPVDYLEADFGYDLPSMISGTVWEDVDRDGSPAPETGDTLFQGVTVRLFQGGSLLATTNTDVNGYYQFTGNYTGQFVVVVSNNGPLAVGTWTPSYDTDDPAGIVSTNQVTTFPAMVDGGSATADFSYYQLGAYDIGDTVYFDVDGDGTQDAGEEGITNITVYLYEDANANGVLDAGTDLLLQTQSTGADGGYLFSDWPTGRYIVVVDRSDPDLPAGATLTGDPDAVKDGRSALSLTATDLNQDFGFYLPASGSIGDTVWRDLNGDGVQSGPNEPGIASVTVWLYADLNGDGTFTNLYTTTTDASGKYLFTGLPDGDYRVVVNAADSDIPKDFFGVSYVPTTSTTHGVTLSGGNTYLGADFGFAPLGAIGDTLFWDLNGDGEQDWNEPGMTNQAVELYVDVNDNGKYDVGTDTYVTNTFTSTNGYYRFDGLTGNVYVVWVKPEGPVTNATLTADPDTDGLPCTHPDVLADPVLSNKCDGAYAVTVTWGTAFMGADFGYQPAGVLGDTVWFDINTNGVRDASEHGIPYIDVVLWSNGTAVATNTTDADGYYYFYDLVDGTYKVVVATSGTNWPAGVGQVYDPDGTNDNQAVGIVVSNLHVVSIGPNAVTNDLDVDFGYRYAGSNVLSGTVGLDTQPYDGLMNGSNPSGVGAGEAAFSNVTVYAWWWRDDGDTNREPGEAVLIASTQTAANGDYVFTGLPEGDGNDFYIISLSAPRSELTLTTTNGSTTAIQVAPTTNALGYVQSAYQALAIEPVTTNIDFAFALSAAYDFGDLPNSYSTSLSATPQGARHRIPGTLSLYLGTDIDAEANGQPTANATDDDLNGAAPDDEDGVLPVGVWSNGSSGGVVRVRVGTGTGWLVGWIDFNQGGTFAGTGEMVVNQAVSSTGGVSGVYTMAFDIPTNGISTTTNTVLNARFRLFPSQPSIPAAAYSGPSNNGEVEDYQWRFAAVGDYVWSDANSNGIPDGGEAPFPGVTVFVDLNSNGVLNAGEPFTQTAGNGTYHIGGFLDGTYRVAIKTNSLPAGSTPTYDIDNTPDWGGTFTISNTTSRSDVDFGIHLPAPTLAVVIDVGAVRRDGRTWVQWRTGAEIGTLGYWMERRTADGWLALNERMLPAKIMQPLPRSYEVPDAGAEDGGTYTYRLVELENTGRRIMHGPYTLTVGGDGYGYAVWAEGIDWGGAASGRGDDPDGDRLTNFEEFLAGTDPLSRDSVLRITHMHILDRMVVLYWRSVEGRVYAVEAGRRPNGPFLPVAAGLEPTPPVNRFVCPLGADRDPMYYRVIVSEP